MISFGLSPLAGVAAVHLDLPNRSLFPALISLIYILGSSCTSLFLRELPPRASWLMLASAGVSALVAVLMTLAFCSTLPAPPI